MYFLHITSMPGRGQPWKKGGHVDDTIQSEDIEDGTIAEVDLDTALQAKVNSASGHEILDEGSSLPTRGRLDFVGAGVVASDGIEDTTTVTIAGGGSPDPFTTYVLLEDFEYSGSVGIVEKYTLLSGIVDAPGSFSQDYGTMEVQSLGTAGNFSGLQSDLSSVKGSDTWTAKIRAVFPISTANRIGVIGMEDAQGFGDSTTIAGIEVFLFDSAIFTFDPARSANWFAVTTSAGTKTETDTGVAPTADIYQDFEIIYTPATNTVFKINGSTVATHTTNLPNALLSIVSAVWTKNAGSKALETDFWQIESTRT